MKKVIVFGGSGFLGSYVADELTRRGYRVVIADIEESPYLLESQEFVRCDIMDLEMVKQTIDGAAVVYNFAGFARLDESINNPNATLSLNIMGNLNVLEASRQVGIDRFVYASSAYAFSQKGSFYGISKFASEKIIDEYFHRFGLRYSVIRYGSLYGERADPGNGIYNLLRQALETGISKYSGNGEEVREYIHAIDAAALSVDIIEDEKYANQYLILTGVEKMRIKELFRMIREILNNTVEIEYQGANMEGHYEVTPYSFHPKPARKLVANPFIDLGQGLVDCIKHIHSELNPDGDLFIDNDTI